MWNAGLDKAQVGINMAGRNINNLSYADDTNLGLKLNIQKTKIMASGPITSWEIDGETMETVTDFIFWVPKSLQMVTATMKLKDTCSLEEKLWKT